MIWNLNLFPSKNGKEVSRSCNKTGQQWPQGYFPSLTTLCWGSKSLYYYSISSLFTSDLSLLPPGRTQYAFSKPKSYPFLVTTDLVTQNIPISLYLPFYIYREFITFQKVTVFYMLQVYVLGFYTYPDCKLYSKAKSDLFLLSLKRVGMGST